MYLARDVLDKEMLDRDGLKAGKVDDLLLELRGCDPPVVKAIITQHGALARNLGGPLPRVGAWLRSHVLGLGPDVQPIQVPWDRVTRIDVTVHIDMDREDDGFTRSEQAVWDRWISHMPWANR